MTITQADFPDLPFVEHIRSHLWRGKPHGRAAVMIGAGFSRNAEPIGISSRLFPLWNELATVLYSGLYPRSPGTPERNYAEQAQWAAANGGVLRLALEYEAAFNRGALDDAVQRALPDADYRPGELHRILLRLPWADVFTTNYDTLLERTLPDIWERRYDVVLSADDLPLRSQPRIFKLHGSMPDKRPYIITEEDYRTYPMRYAPFVNTVQQSLMENAFVLLGFSGTDPNFLQWIGWVRDRLPKALHPIFLCGILDLSPARRQVLRDLNVRPIDLGPLFPRVAGETPDRRHQRSIEWFLRSLANGAPVRTIYWPNADTHIEPATNPPLVPRNQSLAPEIGPHASPRPSLEALSDAWRRKREAYPGWIVLPRSNRRNLSVAEWADAITEGLPTLGYEIAVALAREFVWRLSRAGLPLDIGWAAALEDLCGSEPRARDDVQNADYIRECWVEIGFALARRGRQDGDAAFETWMERLKSYIAERPEWQAQWYYEMCLYHLCRTDASAVRVALADWPTFNTDPFWDTRKASILAELGDLEQARKLARAALNRIRGQLRSSDESVALLSREGWTMLLVRVLREIGDPPSSDRDRWDELAKYRCNASTEFGELRRDVETARLPRTQSRRVTIDPHRGTPRTSYRLFDRPEVDEAFALLMLAEDGAVPFRAGFVSIYRKEGIRAARLISHVAPHWAESVHIRGGNAGDLKSWFDRVRIATMPLGRVLELVEFSRITLEGAVNTLKRTVDSDLYARQQFERYVQILPWFMFRLPAEHVDAFFDMTLGWIESGILTRDFSKYEGLEQLIRELVTASTSEVLSKYLVRLLEFPLPGVRGVTAQIPERWPEPFARIEIPKGLIVDKGELMKAVSHLVSVVTTDNDEARRCAILRLFVLKDANLLTDAELQSFAEALWSRTDEEGLPTHTGVLSFAMLQAPENELDRADFGVRKALVARNFEVIVTGAESPSDLAGWGHSHQPIELLRDWRGATGDPDLIDQQGRVIDWRQDEIEAFWNKLSNWWADQSRWIGNPEAPLMSVDTLRKAFAYIPRILRIVFIPRIDPRSELGERVFKLLTEAVELRVSPATATVTSLYLSPDMADQAAEVVRAGLRAWQTEDIEDAAEATYRWTAGANSGLLPAPPRDLVLELFGYLATRSPNANVLRWSTTLVSRFPHALDSQHLNTLALALTRLESETALPSAEQRPILEADDPAEDAIRLLPGLRSATAELASAVLRQAAPWRAEAAAVVEAAEHWRQIAATDSLPEVRKAFAV